MKFAPAAWLWLGWAATLCAAPPQDNAPLAESKQQLQTLRREQTKENIAAPPAAGALRGAIPTLEVPATAAPPLDPRLRGRDSETENKKTDARKNWLLDGYDKLSRRKGEAGLTGTESPTGEPEAPLDPKDPDYFLRVYEKQRADALAKQQEAQPREARPTVGNDAFAPFLQNWLSGSPVRDIIRDAGGTRPDPTSSAAGPIFGSSPASLGGTPSATANLSQAASPMNRENPGVATNPFIQALGLPGRVDSQPPATLSAPVAHLPGPARTNASHLSGGEKDGPVEARRNPAPPGQDDRKYFPQLKKF